MVSKAPCWRCEPRRQERFNATTQGWLRMFERDSKSMRNWKRNGKRNHPSRTTIFRHLEAIGNGKAACGPHELREEQQSVSKRSVLPLLQKTKTIPFWPVTKMDVYENRWRSAQLLDKEELPKRLPKSSLYRSNIMLSVWWAASGNIYHGFLKPEARFIIRLPPSNGENMDKLRDRH